MMRSAVIYVLVVLSVLGAVATSHALLGARLRSSASAKRPLHIDAAVQLGTLTATGGGNAAPVQVASAVQLGSVTASGGGNAYPTGIASGVALGSVTRSINGAVVNDDTFSGTTLDPNWTSFGPWDEVYNYALANLAISSGTVQLTSNTVNGGAYYAASASDTSQVTLKALYSSTMGAFKGVTLRSGNGSASTTGIGYQVYLYNYASGAYTRLGITRNGTLVVNKTVSVPGTVNHTLKAVYSGGTVTAYVDNTSLGSYTDATPLPPGHPGIFIAGNSSTPVNNTQLDDWSDGGGSAVVLADWTSKPPAGTALRTDGHWSTVGLIGAWPFNEGSGSTYTNVKDGLTKTITATDVTLTATGLQFADNNASATVPIAESAVLNTSQPWTAVIHFNQYGMRAASAWYSILNKFVNSGSGFTVGLGNSSGVVKAYYKINSSAEVSFGTNLGTTYALTSIAFVYDGVNLKVYYNGVYNASVAAALVNPTTQLKLGPGYAGGSNLANTVIAANIWQTALTDAQITDLHTNPWQIFQPH